MNFSEKNRFYSTDISQKEWIGEVISTEDPMKMLRVRAKVYGLFDGEDMDEDMIPWLFPSNSASFSSTSGGSGNFDVPKVGTMVKVSFPNGDIYSGQYVGMPNINESFRNEVLAKEYDCVHAMRLDDEEGLQIYYTPLQGIIMKLKECTVNVTKEQSVHIETKDGNIFELNSDSELNSGKITLYVKCNKNIEIKTDGDAHVDVKGKCSINSGKLELGADGCTENVVLGKSFKKIFDNHFHIGNLGLPTTTASTAGFTCPISQDVTTTNIGGNK